MSASQKPMAKDPAWGRNSRPEIITAVPTVFHDDGSLDVEGTCAIIRGVLDSGVDAVFVNGTTAEFPALDRAERAELARAAIRIATPARVIVHVGDSNTRSAVRCTQDALDAGATRLAAITPYYMPASEPGIERYFAAIASVAGDADLFAYLFPDRTGVRITAQQAAVTILRIGMAGAKVSIPGTQFVAETVAALPPTAAVYSGNDGLLPESMAVGARGVVSGVSSALPRPFVALANSLSNDDAGGTAQARDAVDAAVPVLGPSIAALKHALHLNHTIAGDACRMAIDPLDAAQREAIAALLRSTRERGFA